ncbi:MAG TPA: EAL domain-containing protein [Allosphingosinicella sp.]
MTARCALVARTFADTGSLSATILESSQDCIKLLELDGTILFLNPLGPKALDIEDGAPLLGKCWFDFLSLENAAQAREAVAAAAGGEVKQFAAMQTTALGRDKWFDIVVTPVVTDGAIRRVVVIARDITQQKEAEARLQRSEALHRGVLDASADCIKILRTDGTLELMNGPGMRAVEVEDFAQLDGKFWPSLWPENSRGQVEQAIAEALAGKVSRFTGFCPTALGTPKWWDVVVSPMRDADGSVSRLLSISRDITAIRETSDQLRWSSEHDPLTSLPNRRAFQSHLQGATIKAMETGETIGLLLLDLDHFKHVNDTLGHSAGDHLLRTFGQRLKSSSRSGDFVARLGGDEFAIILRGVRDGEGLVRAGKSLLERLQAPVRLEGRVLSAGASIGGALFPRDAASAVELFKNADTALYALKASGRGGTRLFHQTMREEAQKTASQLSLARIAVSEQSVVPFYQPKVRLCDGAPIGLEALLRWEHPTRGLQLPDTVAEAFKDYELASKIGDLMQRKVAGDIRKWSQAGLEFGRISINAAPAEFLRDDYAERLLQTLAETGVSPERLEVEVTEHVFLERSAQYVERALTLLNRAGITIALDDFGTGYSSLAHLRDFPVDVVKIDRSFVAKMVSDPEIAAIVSAVIDLSRSLAIDVVAEGIETPLQAKMLLEKGCFAGQGFAFGHPADAATAARAMRPRKAAA